MNAPADITFTVEPDVPHGLTAFWDAPSGGGITTCGHTLVDLQANILDAVRCHFGPDGGPSRILLHFAQDVSLVPA